MRCTKRLCSARAPAGAATGCSSPVSATGGRGAGNHRGHARGSVLDCPSAASAAGAGSVPPARCRCRLAQRHGGAPLSPCHSSRRHDPLRRAAAPGPVGAAPPISARAGAALVARCLLAWSSLCGACCCWHGWLCIGGFCRTSRQWRAPIEARASAALGVPVQIGAIEVRSSGWVPALELRDVVLLDAEPRRAAAAARGRGAVAALAAGADLRFEQLLIDGAAARRAARRRGSHLRGRPRLQRRPAPTTAARPPTGSSPRTSS